MGFENGGFEVELLILKLSDCARNVEFEVRYWFPFFDKLVIIAHFLFGVMIFKTTVLEAYWEFGARIGTVVKLTVSTFTSATLFFRQTLFFVYKNRKMTKTPMIHYFQIPGRQPDPR